RAEPEAPDDPMSADRAEPEARAGQVPAGREALEDPAAWVSPAAGWSASVDPAASADQEAPASRDPVPATSASGGPVASAGPVAPASQEPEASPASAAPEVLADRAESVASVVLGFPGVLVARGLPAAWGVPAALVAESAPVSLLAWVVPVWLRWPGPITSRGG